MPVNTDQAESDECDYDEASCVSAGELRAAGYSVPENIPDCAWVPRSSVRVNNDEVSAHTDPGDPSIVHVSVSVEFTEPFKWVEATILLDKGEMA